MKQRHLGWVRLGAMAAGFLLAAAALLNPAQAQAPAAKPTSSSSWAMISAGCSRAFTIAA